METLQLDQVPKPGWTLSEVLNSGIQYEDGLYICIHGLYIYIYVPVEISEVEFLCKISYNWNSKAIFAETFFCMAGLSIRLCVDVYYAT